MAKSGETFGKKEKEQKRAKQRRDKAEKMEQRKANATKGKSLDEMMAYLDENGNLSSSPPDPKRKKTFKVEDMQTGVPNQVEEETIRTGVVAFFDDAKGFGFINETGTGERIFVHINQLSEPLKEGNKVSFEVQRGPKGFNAVNVKKVE